MSEAKPDRAISTAMLLMISVVSIVIIGTIYAFIIMFSGLDVVGMALWIGVISLIFAIVVYFVHALIGDPITLGLSGAFAVIGLLSFYAAIFLCDWKPGDKMIVVVVLSIFVLIFLIVAYRLRRYGEAQEARVEARKKRREEKRAE
jgi:hypothetical protein